MNLLNPEIDENDEGAENASSQSSVQVMAEPKGEKAQEKQIYELAGLVTDLQEKFERSKTNRYDDEIRWQNCYQNYRGIYGPDNQFTNTEKSKAFIKITKTKVLAAYSKITEVLFSGNKYPIGIEPVKGLDEVADKIAVKEKPENPASSVIRPDILERTGGYKKKLESLSDQVTDQTTGAPDEVLFEPARYGARKLEKEIHSQLDETNASKELRHMIMELCVLGHGVMKGPLGMDKEYIRWSKGGEYRPDKKFIPRSEYVSVWDFYPDSDARTIDDCEYTFQRHKMSRTKLKKLKLNKTFRPEAIQRAIDGGPNYIKEYWESVIEDNKNVEPVERWEVLEYWGYTDKEHAEELGLALPSNIGDDDQIQVNVWLCGDEVIRFILNPFQPQRIPYHSVPYELNPYSFFGIGIAENMADTQLIMNGFMRLMIDNAVLSSNLIFEIDETNMVPNQDMSIYPGKVFRRQSGAPGQAIYSHKIQNVINECLQVFDKARQLADEATGMPSFSHGSTGVMGTGRTASGMSMLMSAAAENIKSVVRNIDDYLLAPMGKAYFFFNMQFNFDKFKKDDIGEVEVVAKGTESLMRDEIRSQKILQFLQLTANQLDAPFTRRDYLLRELSQSLDLDPELTVNDPRQAKIQAMIMARIQQQMPQQQPGQPGQGMLGLPSPEGPEAGSGVQPNLPQVPQEPGFQGNNRIQGPVADGQL